MPHPYPQDTRVILARRELRHPDGRVLWVSITSAATGDIAIVLSQGARGGAMDCVRASTAGSIDASATLANSHVLMALGEGYERRPDDTAHTFSAHAVRAAWHLSDPALAPCPIRPHTPPRGPASIAETLFP